MLTKIILPSPSKEIIRRIYELSDSAAEELSLKQIHDNIQNYTKNSVSRKFIEDDPIITNLSIKEFGHFFEEKFIPAAGIVKNINQTKKYACWPPHTDRTRLFALNYYITEGGTNVSTVFYTYQDDYIPGPGTGKIFKYEDLEIVKSYHTQINTWYALSVRQAHSVENIESIRLIFTLSFFDITYQDFLKKYNYTNLSML